jgi:hypothetical protein
MKRGTNRFVDLYLVLTDEDSAGPATQAMTKQIKDHVTHACARANQVT